MYDTCLAGVLSQISIYEPEQELKQLLGRGSSGEVFLKAEDIAIKKIPCSEDDDSYPSQLASQKMIAKIAFLEMGKPVVSSSKNVLLGDMNISELQEFYTWFYCNMGYSLISSLDCYSGSDNNQQVEIDYITDFWNINNRQANQFIQKCINTGANTDSESILIFVSDVINENLLANIIDKYIETTASYIENYHKFSEDVKKVVGFYNWVNEQTFDSINLILEDDYDHYGYKFLSSYDIESNDKEPNAVIFLNALDIYNLKTIFNQWKHLQD